MLGLEEFSQRVSHIYAASAAPDRWQQLLSDLAHDLEATACTLAIGEGSQRQIVSTNIDPEASTAYEQYYHRLDFVAADCESSPIGLVNSGWDLVGSHKRTEFHADWQRRFEMTDGFHVRLSSSPPASLFISAPPRPQPFGTAGRVRFVSALVPHLQRALCVSDQLGRINLTHPGVDTTLDLTPHAVFVVAAGRRVVQMNTSARHLALAPDGLFVRHNRVRAEVSTSDNQLQAAIAKALPNRDGAPRLGGFLRCARPSGKHDFVVRIVPLDTESDPHHSRVAVVVIDTDRQLTPSRELLRSLFAFTATEHEVAIRVVGGFDAKAIAEDLRVSIATIRTHIQRILRKTGTNRQSELLRLLLAVAS